MTTDSSSARLRANAWRWPALALGGLALTVAIAAVRPASLAGQTAATPATSPDAFNDSHFHLTNYVQQGVDIRQFLQITLHRTSARSPDPQTSHSESSGLEG